MATANKNNIVKRIDVNRKLTYVEMDTNFEQLKLVINDTVNLEGQLANKVDTTVYNTKMGEVDASITSLETGAVSEGRIDEIDDRVNTVDDRVNEALVPTWAYISTSQTLTINTRYSVDFSAGPLALTLPALPTVNDFVSINKGNGNPTNSTIARNGNTIMGLAENLTIDFDVKSINLLYNGTDWRIL